jgi:hypothetical protein
VFKSTVSYRGGPIRKVRVAMTLPAVAKFERLIDRVAPTALLALGLAPFVAMALLAG